MKKTLLIVSLVITFVGVLFTSSPYLLKLTGLDQPLKQYLLPKLFRSSSENLDFEDFRLGLSTIYLNNISIRAEDKSLQLHIAAIEINFNLMRLLQNPGQPQTTVTAIRIIEPKVRIDRYRENFRLSSSLPDTQKTQLHNLFEALNQIRSIRRIAISDGEMYWVKKDGKPIQLAHKLSGWLDTRNFSNIIVEAEGSLLASDAANFRISSQIDPSDKELQVKVTIDDDNIGQSLHPLLDDSIAISGGDVHGEFEIHSKRLIADSTVINGHLSVNDADIRKGAHHITDMRFLMNIEDNHLSVSTGSGYYSGQLFDFSGDIVNIFQPEITVSLNSTHFALKKLEPYLPVPALSRSRVDIQATFHSDLKDYTLDGLIYSDSLHLLPNESIKQVKIGLKYRDNRLSLTQFNGSFYGWHIAGKGAYEISKQRVTVWVDGRSRVMQNGILDRLSSKNQRTLLDLTYDLSRKRFRGSWSYSIAQKDDSVFAAGGTISGNDKQLDLILDKTSHPGFSIRVSAQNFLSDQFKLQAHLVNYPFADFTSDPSIKSFLKRFATDARLSGTFGQLNGQIFVNDLQNKRNSFRLNTVISHPFSVNRHIKGSVGFRNLLGFYDVSMTAERINTKLHFPAGISGDLTLSTKMNNGVNGVIRFDKFNILRTLSDSTRAEDFRLQGTIDGEVAVNGTLHDPIFIAKLNGDKFVFNEIGYYQMSVLAVVSKQRVSVDSLSVSLNNLAVLTGKGNWDPELEVLNFRFSGKNLDMQKIVTSLTGKDDMLTGDGAYELSLTGTVQNPKIQGRLWIDNGSVQDLVFEELSLSLEDHFPDLTKFYKWPAHTFIINKLYLAKAGRYHITVDGVLPMDETKPLDLGVQFDGDLFSFIPYWESFFVNGASLTSLNLEVTGTRKNIKVKRGILNIDRGELWLADVAPHIENISGVIRFKEGTNQINIEHLSAFVDGNELQLSTKRNVVLPDGRKLKHWYFKNLDLDFGILAMQTSENGVEVHIPGLMREEDSGLFYLTGLSPGHPFYFAGPVRHPQAIGKVLLYNTYLTYPFIRKGDAPERPSVAVRFLSKIDWDLLVKSGEDVIFFRDIPAFIDRVNMELYVDETSKGLRLRGIINQGTFKPEGDLVSTRGRLEYLDQVFRVDRFSAEFTRNNPLPFVSGRAWTTIRDSIGAAPKTIYLDLYAVDEETGIEKQEGNWENFRFKLVSADPQIGETQEQVLAYMGFSVGNVKEKAVQVGGAVTERYLIRPLLRPVERALEKSLGMDMVRINSAIARNLFYSTLGTPAQGYGSNYYVNPFVTSTSYLMLMQSSGLTVGKYLSQNLFITYTGQLVSVANQTDVEFGINHSVGIEYRFLKNILVEFKYDRELFGFYGSQFHKQYLDDFKIRLRHSFSF